MNEFRTGDRVRIVLETEVVGKRREGRTIYVKANGDDELWFDLDQDDITIEKLAPPVVTFKPGDFIRHKSHTSAYLITNDGVVYLATGKHYAKGSDWCDTYLTSEFYEKVELHEAPL